MVDTSQWAHTDPRGFAAAITSAMVRSMPLESGAVVGWTDAAGTMAERSADLRALLVAGAYLFDEISDRAPREFAAAELNDDVRALLGLTPTTACVLISPRSGDEFKKADASQFAAAVAIMKAWGVIAQRSAARASYPAAPAIPQSLMFATTGGGEAKPIAPASVAAFPIIAVAAIIASAAAISYIAYRVTDVIDKDLARDADAQKLVAVTAGATQVVQQHYEADKAAGVRTPLTAAEQSIIDALNKSIGKLTNPGAPLPAKPDGGSATDGLFAGLGTVGVVILAGVAWFLLKGKG